MTAEISNTEDILDVRDIIECVEELRSELEAERELLADHPAEPHTAAKQTRLDNIASLEEELRPLEALLSEIKGYGGDHQWEGDWYPVALVRDSYFEEYAEELAYDIDAINRNAHWPLNCINWSEAAQQLKIDYGCVDFDGVEYWYR
jgi:hypothetical protein